MNILTIQEKQEELRIQLMSYIQNIDISLNQAQKIYGIPRSYLSMIRSGKRSPKIEVLIRIVNRFERGAKK